MDNPVDLDRTRPLDGKHIVVTGGTGSLGKVLIRRLLGGEMGRPRRVTVFSRDEAKQHDMRLTYKNRVAATDEIVYRNFTELLTFVIGDVRDYHAVASVLRSADVVVNAAALKQVVEILGALRRLGPDVDHGGRDRLGDIAECRGGHRP